MPRKPKSFVLALDAGTTTVKAFVFDASLRVVGSAKSLLGKRRSPDGVTVEQDPQEIIHAAETVLRGALHDAGISAGEVSSLGITNQRETFVLFEHGSRRACSPAIVWEDERTRAECARLEKSHGDFVREKTGLPIIPYFSASKLAWALMHLKEVREVASAGRLAFGTVDTWLIENLAEFLPRPVTDVTNASRTLLFNIWTHQWDEELLHLFGVPRDMLPDVLPSRSHFGTLRAEVLGAPVPIVAVCGDQQASLFAAGAEVGTTKITFGTGTFLMQVLGSEFRVVPPFFTTLAGSASDGALYALERRVGEYGQRVSEMLEKGESLDAEIRRIAKDVSGYVRKLPWIPERIFADGGITNAPRFKEILGEVIGVPVVLQPIPDGTALGIMKLAR